MCQPVSGLEQYIGALGEESLKDMNIRGDSITGSIELDSQKLLCLSVPYSEGWKAYVDGEETPVYQTDTAFLGLMLDKGSHFVELRYHTPYKRIGGAISLAGIILFVIIVIVREKRYVQR